MAIIDLYAPDFPHGSQTGFARGCHGNAECGNYGSEEFVTCREAQIARAGDYNLRKLPADEVLRRDLVWPPQPIPAATPRKPLPTEPMPTVNAADFSAKDDHDATPDATVVPAVGIDSPGKPKRAPAQKKLPVDDPDFPHGTVRGFDWGCRLRDACPAKATTGTSCANAASARAKESANRAKGIRAVYPNPAVDDKKLETTAADLLREVRESQCRELHEVDEAEIPAEQVAEERNELLEDVISAIDDLTQARDELAKAKQLLEEISAAHAAVVAERDNLADELATVRRANSSLAVTIHDLEIEREAASTELVSQAAVPLEAEISKDVTAPPSRDRRGPDETDRRRRGEHRHDHRPAGELTR